MRIVGNGIVNGYGLYNSNGVELRYKIGLRPVVTLKSNINVTESGVLSI